MHACLEFLHFVAFAELHRTYQAKRHARQNEAVRLSATERVQSVTALNSFKDSCISRLHLPETDFRVADNQECKKIPRNFISAPCFWNKQSPKNAVHECVRPLYCQGMLVAFIACATEYFSARRNSFKSRKSRGEKRNVNIPLCLAKIVQLNTKKGAVTWKQLSYFGEITVTVRRYFYFLSSCNCNLVTCLGKQV